MKNRQQNLYQAILCIVFLCTLIAMLLSLWFNLTSVFLLMTLIAGCVFWEGMDFIRERIAEEKEKEEHFRK